MSDFRGLKLKFKRHTPNVLKNAILVFCELLYHLQQKIWLNDYIEWKVIILFLYTLNTSMHIKNKCYINSGILIMVYNKQPELIFHVIKSFKNIVFSGVMKLCTGVWYQLLFFGVFVTWQQNSFPGIWFGTKNIWIFNNVTL